MVNEDTSCKKAAGDEAIGAYPIRFILLNSRAIRVKIQMETRM
jgi:hypothetical protein